CRCRDGQKIVLIDVVLPNLGFGMEEGQLLAWLKAPGDAVRKGEPLAEIEGDKTTVELEALADGVLEEQLVAAGTTVPVGSVLARIRGEGAESVAAESTKAPGATPPASTTAKAKATVAAAPTKSAPGRLRVPPALRRMAREHDLDLEELAASAPGGRITRELLEARIATREPAQETGARREAVALSTMRQIIARRLTQGMQEMPQFFVRAELDFSAALGALPAGVGVNALLLWLTVQALKEAPAFNATFEDGTLWRHRSIDLAQAVALPDGLLTPVLRDAGSETLEGLGERSRDLVARARAGRLKPEEMQGGSFTLSNLGVVQQVDEFTAIINPPQIGILAVGALRERPLVIDGGLHVRTTARLTLTADHRFVDGMLAAEFIAALDHHLQAFDA
ncbi:MAG: dihydrolipoamide acetyltransferase family protein, partial [Anaerolineaceae bacterium]|nr:dihydrolipoamide acetyltransferase family protein [Anaerolineaceae bacterium]